MDPVERGMSAGNGCVVCTVSKECAVSSAEIGGNDM